MDKQLRSATKPPEFPQYVWDHVQQVLDNDELTQALGDCVMSGRLEALERMTSTDPGVHRGQLAFIQTCWHLRRALTSLGWTSQFIENQEVFRCEGQDGLPASNLVHFSGLISDDLQAIESNPRGKRTKIGIRSNQLQYEFNFDDPSSAPSPSPVPEIWFFTVSTWDLVLRDGRWSGRIKAWLAFCDGALTRSGEEKPLGDESKFSRIHCLDYRAILDQTFGSELPVAGPPPVKASPTVLEILEEGKE
jgi:hypothetical protein